MTEFEQQWKTWCLTFNQCDATDTLFMWITGTLTASDKTVMNSSILILKGLTPKECSEFIKLCKVLSISCKRVPKKKKQLCLTLPEQWVFSPIGIPHIKPKPPCKKCGAQKPLFESIYIFGRYCETCIETEPFHGHKFEPVY